MPIMSETFASCGYFILQLHRAALKLHARGKVFYIWTNVQKFAKVDTLHQKFV